MRSGESISSVALPLQVADAGVVDRGRVRRHLRELEAELDEGAAAWIVPRAIRFTLIGLIGTVMVPAIVLGDLQSLVDPSAPLFWARWLAPAVLSVPATVKRYIQNRRKVKRGAEALAVEMSDEWSLLTREGWIGRTIQVGAAMGVGVGLPVGLILSTQLPLGDGVWSRPVLGALAFAAASAIWAVPIAFGLRAIVLKSLRSFVRPEVVRSLR